MIKQIATHNKIFHADEITAIALLKVFKKDTIVVNRVDHSTEDFSNFDMLIDIGRKFDGVKYFDHHQYKGGKSSAGLIWDYVGLEKEYPKVSRFINLIDKNDVGIKRAGEFEFPSLIRAFNSKEINNEEQNICFNKAVDFTITVLNSMKTMEEDILEAKDIVNNSYFFESNKHIIELDKYTPHWSTFINGNTMPNIKAVVWEDTNENN
ncbi:MYG1 family protein [Poseidonibacter antarcticus]|uniref:MYG1 family protein n=1 Tax=Poseidonibacter antarcticus TaxID=2478538 RepID=UPI000EF4E626|nr:MYG1 family protein [Poseidonibacter antarcticus]